MNPLQKIRYWYRWIFEPQFLAGEKAEQHFEKLSGMKGYILEKIPQDRNNFGKYKDNSQNHIDTPPPNEAFGSGFFSNS